MRVAFETLGCRLNQAETDAMEAALSRDGHTVVDEPETADVYVLNSCTITHQADADARRRVRRARRRNADLRVIVTGCWANAQPRRIAALDDVDVVLGNGEKDRLAEHLRGPGGTHVAPPGAGLVQLRASTPRHRVRALLKVQDGCNYRCAFCIVPHVRGPSRSLPPAQIGAQLRRLVDAGTPEVVLTGIHLGAYGRDLRPRVRLPELVAALLPSLGPARLRLSSIDPHEVDDELVALLAAHPDKICRHLHLPVQSGDPDVLRRMRRGHTADDFARLVDRLATAVPGIGIGTDVIVGFPGEDAAAFERTRSLLAGLPVAYHHVFTYSPRSGTAAAEMPDQVPAPIKAERNRVLRELSDAQGAAFAGALVGQQVDAVVVRARGGGLRALTDNYVRLPVRGASYRAGMRAVVSVRADDAGPAVYAR